MYKINCGFKWKANVCTFKEKDCGENCDFFDLPFTSKSIKDRLKILKDRKKELKNKYFKITVIKKTKKLIESGELDKEKMKKISMEYLDINSGIEYLEKSYKYCKRAGL